MWAILDLTIYAAGFATCWVCKDSVLRLVTGARALIGAVQAKLAALREKF